MRSRKRQPDMFIWIILVICAVIAFLFIGKIFISSPGRQANAVVKSFYTYEQEGNFHASWSLFHSLMQERFEKGPYMQDRAHVFMNHFGVDSFTFDVSKPEKLEDWQISNDADPLGLTYRMTVSQFYESKYGNFTIYQQVFVVMEEGEWRVLWDYNH